MRTFDLSPLYRPSVSIDRLPLRLDSVVQRDSSSTAYPQYNIEGVDEDRYRITMAVAGFVQGELNIQTEKQILTVTGKKPDEDSEKNYLHQGIASRNFERKFQVADYVEVSGAKLENGLLHIDLFRKVPDAIKPRTIVINSGNVRKEELEKAEAA